MNVTTEKQPKGLLKITAELSVQELEPYLKSAASRLAERTEFPGFRPGKAPYNMVKQRLGESAIYQEAAEEIVRKTYPRAVLDNKIEAIGQPKIELIKLAPGNPFVYTALVALLPQLKLGNYKKLKARKKKVKVDPKEVNKTIEQLRKMRAKETLVDRPAKIGDRVEVDLELFLDNVPIENGTSKNHPVVIGDKQFIPGFEEQLVGLKKNETKEFQLNYPKEFYQKNLAGRLVDYRVKMNAVYQIDLPELNEDFIKSMGKFKDRNELEAKIRANLEEEAENKEHQRFELEILNEIIDNSRFEEIPEILVKAELQRILFELRSEVESRGLKFYDYLKHLKKTESDLENEFKPQAERRIKSALILRAIRTQENIIIEADKIDAEIKKQKEIYKDDLETYNKIDSPEYRDQYEEMLKNRKIFEFLENQIESDKK